jgi:hypothetical protein
MVAQDGIAEPAMVAKPQGSLLSSSTPGDTLGEGPLHLVVLDRYVGS